MYFIGIDASGRLLTRNLKTDSGDKNFYCLPEIPNPPSSQVFRLVEKNGLELLSEPEFFGVRVGTTAAAIDYCIAPVKLEAAALQDFEFRRLDQIWKEKLDSGVTLAMNRIVNQIFQIAPATFEQLEHSLITDFELRQLNKRVFFALSDSVVVNETLASVLGAFANVTGEKTARVCLHSDQQQPIQEMLMIHSEPIATGPLRQNRNSSVSYHMLRGALEITLHHGAPRGDQSFIIERHESSPSLSSSLRAPARVFRTIRTLTDSAIFIEVQSGPFNDSDTVWGHQKSRALIVGATGLIGASLCNSLRQRGHRVLGTSREASPNNPQMVKLDFQSPADSKNPFDSISTSDVAVFSCGMTKSKRCEQHPDVSNLINNIAQVNLASLLLRDGCKKVVLISSNQVFDGSASNVFSGAEYSPNSVYGHHKAAAEKGFLQLGGRAKILRLTKVFSEKSPLLTAWIGRLKNGMSISAFNDVLISPISLEDTVQVIEEIMFEESEQISQFSATDEVSYFQVAQILANEVGASSKLVLPQSASERGEIAMRYPSLECSRFRKIKPRSSEETVRLIVRQLTKS